MSPEAARMCRYVGHISMFPDHVTLFADFAVPEKITSTLTWLRPTSIPWDKINQETWHHNLGRLPAPDHQLLYSVLCRMGATLGSCTGWMCARST